MRIAEVLVLAQHAMFMLMKIGLINLQKKEDAEEDMLDMAHEPNKFSRLACQITVDRWFRWFSRKNAIKTRII